MTTEIIVALVAVFGSVAVLAALAASSVLASNAPGRRRLRGFASAKTVDAVQAVGLANQPDPVWDRLSRAVPKSPKDMIRLRRRLANAGYRSLGAAVVYASAEWLLPLALGGTCLLVVGLRDTRGLFAAAFLALVGFFLPGLFLEHKISVRRKQVQNGLPDVLDLLIVCLEAGSSLDQAIVKASEELEIAYPALADELRIMNVETRAGKPRIEAFKNLAQRTKVEDVRSLVAMLVQTDRFGTSVSQALRTFADSLRTKRRQQAEERAAKVGVKLVFPLVLCLFPAFFVVTLGPMVIQFVRVFVGQVLQQVK